MAATDDDYVKALKGQLYSRLRPEEEETSPSHDKKLIYGKIPAVVDIVHLGGDPSLSVPNMSLNSGEISMIEDVIHGERDCATLISPPEQDKMLISDKRLTVADVIHTQGDSILSESSLISDESQMVAESKLNSRGRRISPEVENALSMMNQVIAAFKELKYQKSSLSATVVKDPPSEEKETQVRTISEYKHDLLLIESR